MKFFKNLFGKSSNAESSSDTENNRHQDNRKKSNNKSATIGGKTKPKASNSNKSKPSQKKPRQQDLAPITLPPDFAELNLPLALGHAIDKLGFTSCTPVQKDVLPHSLDGEDVIAQAQTGTGKTAAFLFSVLTYHIENPEIDKRPPGTPFALVIAPTRELVLQITSDAEQLSEFMDFSVMAVVGGMDYEKQKTQLKSNVDLIVATPGRLIDFLRSGTANLSRIEMLIIDEADRMLSMGFIPDVKSIISRTPKKQNRQTQLFSATFSEDIKRLASSWTLDPVRIEIAPESVATDNVKQLVYLTGADQKLQVLYNLICSEGVDRVIVFVNRRDQTRTIESKLYRLGIDCGLLSGEVAQKKRIKTLDAFKSGEIKVLVATDVAGRGIHVDNVTHVVNYNLPEDPEDYVHRIGRTGRAGATGTSVSLACEDDSFMLPGIETLLGISFDCEPPPETLTIAMPAPVRPARKQVDGPPSNSRGNSRGGGNSGRGNHGSSRNQRPRR